MPEIANRGTKTDQQLKRHNYKQSYKTNRNIERGCK